MKKQPNIVFIVADNQSPWTLGCYGNNEILTPNIDRLAAAGARFTNAFCSNPVCSPNRATLLTGLMPSQHGVHNWLGCERPCSQMGADAYCTIQEFATLPKSLADAGYDCGMSGKWHLGDSMRAQLGFRYWFCKPYGWTRSFQDQQAIFAGKEYTQPGYFPEAITEHAVDFLRQDHDEKPFFLYVGYNGPYGLDKEMLAGHRNRHTAYYADKELTCFPRTPIHPWLKEYRDRMNNETARRSYAAAVSGVDDGVGGILDTLAELGLEEDTLVVYTADHGLCGGHHGMWGMGDHSRPLHMFQENLRVPLLVRHPGQIDSGRVIDHMTCNYDMYPTLRAWCNAPLTTAEAEPLPGRGLTGLLNGTDMNLNSGFVVHEYENTRAVQSREWKLIRRWPYGPDELYHLSEDPGETVNLIHEPQYTEDRDKLDLKLHNFFSRHVDPQYDLWNAGRSKAGRILKETKM